MASGGGGGDGGLQVGFGVGVTFLAAAALEEERRLSRSIARIFQYYINT
jgi:hypothetical protein